MKMHYEIKCLFISMYSCVVSEIFMFNSLVPLSILVFGFLFSFLNIITLSSYYKYHTTR